MMPHKTVRGQVALGRLAVRVSFLQIYILLFQTFEGIPEPYDKMKRMVVPDALKVIRMRADRNYTVLGQLSTEVGWGYAPLIEKLEAQRKIKEQAYYAEKKAARAQKAQAIASADLSKVAPVLASYGY